MADLTKTSAIVIGKPKSQFLLSSSSDGTGETGVRKIVLANLPGSPTRMRINKISWNINDGSVSLTFDRTGATPVVYLNGHGDVALDGGLGDAGTGLTGDLLLTTIGFAAKGGYVILLEVESVE